MNNKDRNLLHKRIRSHLIKKIGLKKGGNSTKYDRFCIRLSTGRLHTVCVLAHPKESYKKFSNLLGFYSPAVVNLPDKNIEKTSNGFGVLSRYFIVISNKNFKDSMKFIKLAKKTVYNYEENKISNKKKTKSEKAKVRNETKKQNKKET